VPADDDADLSARRTGARRPRDRPAENETHVRAGQPAELPPVEVLERALYPARGRERVRALIGGHEGAAVLARRPAQGRLQCRLGVGAGPRSLGPGERPGARGEGKDEERERRPDLQAGAQPCGDWPFLSCPGGVLSCPGGVLACPGGVSDVSGAATAGVSVVVVVGWLFP